MDKLKLIRSESFGAVMCDFWKNSQGEIMMTGEQLGTALEYADPIKAISNLVARNPYLADAEFSVVLKMRSTDGKRYMTRLFTEDGIYEVAMLSGTDRAKAFRAWIRGVLKALRKGEAVILATKQIRREFTDVLEETGENARMFGYAHKNYTDLIYKKTLGKLAYQIRNEMSLPRTANVREHLPLETRVEVARMEDAVKAFVAFGYSYAEIKEFLSSKALPGGDQ
jgi:prophage antirepressor-like protein